MQDLTVTATFRNGRVEFDEPRDWPDGTRLQVVPVASRPGIVCGGHVIIVGFGLAGRGVADLLDRHGVPYLIVEKNLITIETQRALGRKVVSGSVTQRDVLIEAGIHSASILALTIPDEEAVLDATAIARRLRPDIYIIARTNYASQGMRCTQLGADDVVKAEQAVAIQFYEKLGARLGLGSSPDSAGRADRECSSIAK